MLESIEIRATVERKYPNRARSVVVPANVMTAWELVGTTLVDVWINRHPIGRRKLKAIDDARWLVELTDAQCKRAHVDTGAQVSLRLRLAAEKAPPELTRLLADHSDAKAAWDGMTPERRRAVERHAATARVPSTRWRRSAAGLGVDAPVPADLVRPRRDKTDVPMRVQAHWAEDNEESRGNLDEAIGHFADILGDQILCLSWYQTLVHFGDDPGSAPPPPELRLRPDVWKHWLAHKDPWLKP